MSQMESNRSSAWAPLGIPIFRAIWLVTLISNIGTWMHDIGAGWLMTSLSPSPVMVALVQTATTLPMFILALPAGALADIVERRCVLIFTQLFMALVATTLATLTIAGIVTPWTLVFLTFAMGIGSALMMPAWAAIVPELVPRKHLPSAIALNSMGINVARAIGPAIAGVIISFAGSGAVFALNALSFAGVIAVLLTWRPAPRSSNLPPERVWEAMLAGLRFTRYAPELQAVVVRGIGFFFFASASWAMLPLVARQLESSDPKGFGMLVSSIGAGAVLGALVLPTLKARFSRDRLVVAATLMYVASLTSLAMLDNLWLLTLSMAASGIAWIIVLSSLQVTAQLSLPEWVRSRGLAVYVATFMGSMALGSLCWGKVAALYNVDLALSSAAAGMAVAIMLTWRWSLNEAEALDLNPAGHWPAAPDIEPPQRDTTLVTIEYIVTAGKERVFLHQMQLLGVQRQRDGAFNWAIYQDAEQPRHYLEQFNERSWLAHLRQHERVTKDTQHLQQRIHSCLDGRPRRVRHYIKTARPTRLPYE